MKFLDIKVISNIYSVVKAGYSKFASAKKDTIGKLFLQFQNALSFANQEEITLPHTECSLNVPGAGAEEMHKEPKLRLMRSKKKVSIKSNKRVAQRLQNIGLLQSISNDNYTVEVNGKESAKGTSSFCEIHQHKTTKYDKIISFQLLGAEHTLTTANPLNEKDFERIFEKIG